MRAIILLFLSIFTFATTLQNAKSYNNSLATKNWLMSEKLDGIRGYWDGKNFYTRKGKKIHTPQWLTNNFPNFELDGELWTKRADFENIQNIVMDKSPSKKWKEISYNIFEVPNSKGDFQKRLHKAKAWFEKHPNKNVKIIKQYKIKNNEDIEKYFEEVTSKSGEGLIIKNPKLIYNKNNIPYVIKLKKADDMEGEVIAITISKKTKVLKSLVVKLENEIVFNLGGGFTDEQRRNPPKIGDIVTFKYYGFTKRGKPRFASFLHIRKD